MIKQEVERDYLTEEEFETIASKDFGTERLNHVRDIFLFSCFTGLAYADVRKLKNSEIGVGIDEIIGYSPAGRKPIPDRGFISYRLPCDLLKNTKIFLFVFNRGWHSRY